VLDFEEGMLRVSSTGREGTYSGEMELAYSGPSCRRAFHARYLQDTLAKLPKGPAKLRLVSAGAEKMPVMLEVEGHEELVSIIQPFRVDDYRSADAPAPGEEVDEPAMEEAEVV
jgi:hypothetical protein